MFFPFCISDATGYGKLQISTAMVRSPYGSKSAAVADIFGVGNVDDGRKGCVRLFGANRDTINEYIAAGREKRRVPFVGAQDEILKIIPGPLMINDLSSLRHCEHIANSGICGCPREQALRVTPKKPRNIAEMLSRVRTECISQTYAQRVRW